MNILKFIREKIQTDPYLNKEIGNRIYFYETTENSDKSDSFIVLNEIDGIPSNYASDKYLAEDYLIQVDVECYTEEKAINITKKVRKLLWDLDMKNASSQMNNYFKATKRYVRSRRYEGIPKNEYYKGERVE
ncbi:hypothetical protein [Staphylococcus xylosus]|uniref:hypothetical protein n=1 Tax=Staphylococcus xylosus TaxID=1288 RepID=UPI002DBA120D|nr:hypothetical protein [Staphylococcus xylosus]MEB8101053.1 hypothetical protein [Staphylococcus xylosus]